MEQMDNTEGENGLAVPAYDLLQRNNDM